MRRGEARRFQGSRQPCLKKQRGRRTLSRRRYSVYEIRYKEREKGKNGGHASGLIFDMVKHVKKNVLEWKLSLYEKGRGTKKGAESENCRQKQTGGIRSRTEWFPIRKPLLEDIWD